MSRASNFFRGLSETGAGLGEQWLCKNYYRGKHKGDTHEEGHRWRWGYAHTLARLSVCTPIRASERARTCGVAGRVHAWVYAHVRRLVRRVWPCKMKERSPSPAHSAGSAALGLCTWACIDMCIDSPEWTRT